MAISSFSSRALFGGFAFFTLVLAIISLAWIEAKTPQPYFAGKFFFPPTQPACESSSESWHGRCVHQEHCDKQCRLTEKKDYGACHGLLHSKCYCYRCGKCQVHD
ncbi:hypothetical protein FH972_005036 [Carpinus fangiana]|uniref:Knottins-like domain-containing protein n=1 Tax=Carpinus fangiana TaxID=176857 RepID=A0A5N6QQW1_9ROSI|nr:hypothetical protein FH972_005036 [Carpinus fangiana]